MGLAVFSINLVLGPFWKYFSKFSKKDPFQKVYIEKLFLLLNLVSLDFTPARLKELLTSVKLNL